MKTLNTYINEWKANTSTVSSIKTQYFVYKTDRQQRIKIFDKDWPQFKTYKDKVYINGKNVELDDDGRTITKLEPEINYNVEIEDIDNVTNCKYMFYYCIYLVEVPLFNTSKVKDMYKMFYKCENLEEVPLFDTSKVKNMVGMFKNCERLQNVPLFDISKVENMACMFQCCDNLNKDTEREWSKIYDFEYDVNKK